MTVARLERQEAQDDRHEAHPQHDGQPGRPYGQDELRDDGGTGLRTWIDRFDPDERAQWPVQQPHDGRGHDHGRAGQTGQLPRVAGRAVP